MSASVYTFMRVDVDVFGTSDVSLVARMNGESFSSDRCGGGQVVVVKLLCLLVGLSFEVGQRMYGFI